MDGSKSVANLKLAIVAVAEIGSASAKVMEDGKVSLGDLRYAPALLNGIKSASGVNYKELLPEAKDMSEGEQAEIAQAFREHFVLKADAADVEATIEEGLVLVLSAIDAVLGFVKVSAAVKPAA